MKIVREPTRVIASVFSLCGFLVAVLAGWRAGASTGTILLNAVLAMIVCKAVGLLVGWMGQTVIKDFLIAHRNANPVPSVREAERAMLRGERPGQARPVGSTVDTRVHNAAA